MLETRTASTGDVSSWALSPAEAPPRDGQLSLVVCERTLSKTRIAELEAAVVFLSPERVRRWFTSEPSVREVGVLRTCQRAVVIALTDHPEAVGEWVGQLGGDGTWDLQYGEGAIHRLHRIAAGLDSRTVGEREIRDQVALAASTVLSRYPRPVVREILLAAANGRRAVDLPEAESVADLAVEWLVHRLPRRDAVVVVIGAGTVGRRVADGLAGKARVTVLYRRHPPAPSWAEQKAIRVRPSEEMARALRSAQAVVAAAKTLGRVLNPTDLPSDPREGPRWFVDLGLPRNIDPEIARRSGSELVDLEGLPSKPWAPEQMEQLNRSVDEAAKVSVALWNRVRAEAWVSELRGWAEQLRREEWERAVAHAGPVSEQARLAFQRGSDRLVRRLLAGPTEELRESRSDATADERRQRLVEMFRDPDAGPRRKAEPDPDLEG